MSKTFIGASQLAYENSGQLDDLIDQVTSKGGMTIEAVNVLRETNISQIIDYSLNKAYSRSKELSK